MKKLAVAVAAAALMGVGPAAEQAARTSGAQAPANAPKLSPSRSSAQPESTAARKPASSPATKSNATSGLSADAQNQLVKQYCAGCHSDRGKAGGLTLAGFDAAKIEEHGEIAEKMIRKLRTGMMPPPNARRPEPELIKAFVDTLETKIDAAAALNPNPGWRPFQRLNRAEYQHAVRDLLGIDVDVTAYLPPDTISHGFDNVADVQNFSPTLMESYLRAASQISRLAVGDRSAQPRRRSPTRSAAPRSQMRHVDGAPMGTRGGISVVHTFPADGDYVIKMSMHNEPLGGHLRPHLDGDDGHQGAGRGVDQRRARGAARPQRADERDRPEEQPRDQDAADSHHGRPAARLRGVHPALRRPARRPAHAAREHAGRRQHQLRRHRAAAHARHDDPRAVDGHRRVRHGQPPDDLHLPADQLRRKKRPARRRSSSAWRRRRIAASATPDDMQDAMLFYEQGRKKGDFESGIRHGAAVDSRQPALPVPPRAGAAATRSREGGADLSHQRSGSRVAAVVLPLGHGARCRADEGRRAAARCTTPAGLEKQVRRMLADRRSEALSTRFAGQWLRLQDLEKIHPDYLLYPAVRRHAGAGDAARDRALLRQHRARGSAACSTC